MKLPISVLAELLSDAFGSTFSVAEEKLVNLLEKKDFDRVTQIIRSILTMKKSE